MLEYPCERIDVGVTLSRNCWLSSEVWLLALSVALAALAAAGSAAADDIVGRASVIDGDTIEIHGTRIRLWDIDISSAARRR